MGLDIFFREDIRNALLAANEATSATVEVIADCINGGYEVGMVTAVMRAYRMGYKAALSTLALAFGLTPAIIGGVHGQDATSQGQEIREIGSQPHRLGLK